MAIPSLIEHGRSDSEEFTLVDLVGATTGTVVLTTSTVAAVPNRYFRMYADGSQEWGNGAGTFDVMLSRTGATSLSITPSGGGACTFNKRSGADIIGSLANNAGWLRINGSVANQFLDFSYYEFGALVAFRHAGQILEFWGYEASQLGYKPVCSFYLTGSDNQVQCRNQVDTGAIKFVYPNAGTPWVGTDGVVSLGFAANSIVYGTLSPTGTFTFGAGSGGNVVIVNGTPALEVRHATEPRITMDRGGTDVALINHDGSNMQIGSITSSALILQTFNVARLTISADGTSWTIASATSITLPNACNIVVNATTGTKIGTANTQKLGFWNTTAVVQPAAIADLGAFTGGVVGFLDAAERDGIRTKLNDILAKLRLPGFIAT